MPFDGTEAKFVKPEVFSLEGLVAWLETQPADEHYSYYDNCGCLLFEYFESSGVPVEIVSGITWLDTSGNRNMLDEGWASIAAARPHTYGAALSRARHLPRHGLIPCPSPKAS